jgi:hypothetical protein
MSAYGSAPRRPFINTDNNRLCGRIDIKTDDIGGLRHELGVVALAPGFTGGKIDIVLAHAGHYHRTREGDARTAHCSERARHDGSSPALT